MTKTEWTRWEDEKPPKNVEIYVANIKCRAMYGDQYFVAKYQTRKGKDVLIDCGDGEKIFHCTHWAYVEPPVCKCGDTGRIDGRRCDWCTK